MIRMSGRMDLLPWTQVRRTLRNYWVALALMLAVTSALRAQVLYGVLVGNLTDTTGAGVIGAKIIASNQATGIAVSVNSDESGHFLLNNLAPGTYTLTVSAASFKKTTSQGLIVLPNIERRADFRLQPESVNETVEVTAAPPDLQTDRATVAIALEQTQLQELPSGPGPGMRNVQSLYTVVPGFLRRCLATLSQGFPPTHWCPT